MQSKTCDHLSENTASRKRGFTLVEVMVVIGLAAILLAVTFGSISVSRGQARDVRRISDIKEIQLELALYYDLNRTYPTTGQGLNKLVTDGFMTAIPQNPSGSAYSYQFNSATNKYCIGVLLEQITASTVDGYVNCTLSGSTGNFYKTQR